MLKMRKMLLGAFCVTFRFINDYLAHGLKTYLRGMMFGGIVAFFINALLGHLPHMV